MKPQSQPLPDFSLSRTQWRCLRVISEVSDIAHAARKLHWSQALLRAALAELHGHVGAQHIVLSDERVQLSLTLKKLICQRHNGAQQDALTNRPDLSHGTLPRR